MGPMQPVPAAMVSCTAVRSLTHAACVMETDPPVPQLLIPNLKPLGAVIPVFWWLALDLMMEMTPCVNCMIPGLGIWWSILQVNMLEVQWSKASDIPRNFSKFSVIIYEPWKRSSCDLIFDILLDYRGRQNQWLFSNKFKLCLEILGGQVVTSLFLGREKAPYLFVSPFLKKYLAVIFPSVNFEWQEICHIHTEERKL